MSIVQHVERFAHGGSRTSTSDWKTTCRTTTPCTDLQGRNSRSYKLETVNNKESPAAYRNNRGWHSRRIRLTNIQRSYPAISLNRRVNVSSTKTSWSSFTAMSVIDLVAAVESGEFNLDDKTSVESTTFCRVCLNDDHDTSEQQQVKNPPSVTRI